MPSTENGPSTPASGQVPPAAPRFLVPRPVSDEYDHGRPVGEDDQTTMQHWGWCADFCESSDSARTDGLTLPEHGPWCRSLSTALVEGLDAAGEAVTVVAYTVSEYRHGIYRREAVHGLRTRTFVQLVVEAPGVDGDGDVPQGRSLNLDVGDALRLAAGIRRAVRVADRLDVDLHLATDRRRRGL